MCRSPKIAALMLCLAFLSSACSSDSDPSSTGSTTQQSENNQNETSGDNSSGGQNGQPDQPMPPAEFNSSLRAGYDWQLPDWAEHSNRGALVRHTWSEKTSYSHAAFYSMVWHEIYTEDGDYDFSEFDWWLNNHLSGDKAAVRLELNSRCDVPKTLRGQLNYYAGGSIAFWEPAYQRLHKEFVTAFANRYAADPRVVGVYLGIADGEYEGIEHDQYTRTVVQNGVPVTIDSCDEVDYYQDDRGWGEFWMSESELQNAISKGFSSSQFFSSVKLLVDDFKNAFGPHHAKLAFTNFGSFIYDDNDETVVSSEVIDSFNTIHREQIIPYVINSGIGNRDGLVEDWMNYVESSYGMKLEPSAGGSCYLRIDDSFATQVDNRYWASENEEYGSEAYIIDRHGPLETHDYRFVLSSLRSLQMRRNYIKVLTSRMGDLPQSSQYRVGEFLNYLATTVGRNRNDTPDAFVVLGERYSKDNHVYGFNESELLNANGESCRTNDNTGNYVRIREFGRWLSETSASAKPAVPLDLTDYVSRWSSPDELPALPNGAQTYEYSAQESHKFSFDLDDSLAAARCSLQCKLQVKVTFTDSKPTTLSLVNQDGTLATIATSGNGSVFT